MSDDTQLLSDAEMSYLQSVFESEEDGAQDFTEGQISIPFEQGVQGDFLQFLSRFGSLQLQGSNGRCQLQFACSVNNPADEVVSHLSITYPSILEQHDSASRSLRVPPAPDQILTLIDPTGTLQSPEVLNLSLSGLSICDHPPNDLSTGTIIQGLILQLPNGPALQINAQVVRSQNSDGVIALGLQLLEPDESVRQQLGAYVFRRYQETEMVAK